MRLEGRGGVFRERRRSGRVGKSRGWDGGEVEVGEEDAEDCEGGKTEERSVAVRGEYRGE